MKTKLRNLGPKSMVMLAKAGIGPEELHQIGSVRSYLKVRTIWPEASLNFLWALEGAICDEPWQKVARDKRLSLLLALEEEESRQ